MAELKLLGKIIIKGRIETKTGLHIGGAQGNLEIGGLDNAVIKDAVGKPYIPGSSLKGKMRSLLERYEGYLQPDKLVYQKKGNEPIRIHMCDEPECPVCLIFGRNHGKQLQATTPEGREFRVTNVTPTRLQVRDAFLDELSLEGIKENLDLEYTEVKFENSLDRITSAANPRQQERVPRGAQFQFEMVYDVLCEDDMQRFAKVLTAMILLEDDYLGGAGSRGSGQVKFKAVEIIWKSREVYESGGQPEKTLVESTLDDIIRRGVKGLFTGIDAGETGSNRSNAAL
ncbi:type III-A CRISPR-associated RAMP protein Csm3 [Methylomusa anaerophila]|uniref:CRISPR system Cms endoribonuclease Csm3 n=1 Tax=Methylomusa anaerophila TaxID=1930071 RepID=A0A348AR47_9FIRM|nr:type III-A CRISPR-associated RAMP protein Csm3 [Methylomusa anaerophila]BBB93545.1 RAMP superfamily protein [Methylomusa anaerophila]